MSKYILEVNSGIAKKIVVLGMAGEECVSTVFKIDELEELTGDYINEHFGQLQDDAYKRGFEDGKKAIHKGCEECKYEGGTVERNPCFTCCNSYQNYWTAKKQDDEIKVGDTVNIKDDRRKGDGIVTKSWENDRYFIMWADGSGGVWDKEYIVKTGKHFDIDKILEEMKE